MIAESLEENYKPGSIDEAIEFLTMYMSLSKIKPWKNGGSIKFHSIPASYFDGAEPWIFMEVFYDEEYMKREQIFSDAKPTDIEGDLDVKMISAISDEKSTFRIQRIKRINPKIYRGFIQKHSPYIVEIAEGDFNVNKDSCLTHRKLLGYCANDEPNKRWKPVSKLAEQPPVEDLLAQGGLIQGALGIQFARRYDWRVYLGWEGCLGITFVTTPVGAREVFKLRDIPNGRMRRAALKHWVREHYRKKINDPTETTKVIKHLRGAEEFLWNGLKCKIMPARFDLEQVEKAKTK
jgi:hypothetical protein